MQNCPKCNAELPDTSRFCPACGAAQPGATVLSDDPGWMSVENETLILVQDFTVETRPIAVR